MTFRGRYLFIAFILVFALAVLIWRMLDLNVFNRGFLLKQGNARIVRTISIPAYRGIITDRHGAPLAISTPVDSVWINPQLFAPTPEQAKQMAQILGVSKDYIKQQAEKDQDKEFTYIKRRVPPEIGEQIKALDIAGVNLQREYQRFYPEGAAAAQIVGFTNIDDHGQEGLELGYNQWLQGVPGKRQVVKDRLGHIVAVIADLKQPQQGNNLVLSIDHRLQYFAYEALSDAVAKYNAQYGSIVVIDVKTGEVITMVNAPSYNPNQRIGPRDGRYRNRAVTDMFEPGSTLKAFTLTSALQSGKYTPDTMIDTSPGALEVDGNLVKEVKHHNYGKLTLTGVLEHSSNVGTAKVILSLPAENLINFLRQMGFGERTASGFPGEAEGSWGNHTVWPKFDLATLSFGYSISVTALQLAQAYAILAADGIKRPVTFLKVNQPLQSQRVISPELAHQALTMLQAVVESEGTGTSARVPGYQVAGKTGTAEIAAPHGYYRDRHVASFIGVAPVSDPHFVVAVIIYDLRGSQYYGAQVAAPLFAKVMSEALRLFNVTPDNLK